MKPPARKRLAAATKEQLLHALLNAVRDLGPAYWEEDEVEGNAAAYLPAVPPKREVGS